MSSIPDAAALAALITSDSLADLLAQVRTWPLDVLPKMTTRIEELEGELEQVREWREIAIGAAIAAGIPQRTIAEAARISPGRVGQIATKGRTS